MNAFLARIFAVCVLSVFGGLVLTAVRAEDQDTSADREFQRTLPGDVLVRFAVQSNSIQWDRDHTALTFMCRVVIENRTHQPLTVTNLFQEESGLALRVTDKHGTELSRLLAPPFHRASFKIEAGSSQVFFPYYGIVKRFTPGTNETLRLQLRGELIGSGYTNRLASDLVNLKIP